MLGTFVVRARGQFRNNKNNKTWALKRPAGEEPVQCVTQEDEEQGGREDGNALSNKSNTYILNILRIRKSCV